MVNEVDGLAQEPVEIDRGTLGAAGAGEVEQAIDDFRGAEALLRDLFENGGETRVAAHLLGQHLGVGGDDGKRCVHFVRDTGGEQADRGEFLCLS